jgi:hypothetical protein
MRLKLCSLMLLLCFCLAVPSQARTAGEIIQKVDRQFRKIKDATADLILDYNINLLGCAGNQRMTGKGYFKAPDKGKALVEGITYFARGNQFRKIDEKGKKFYVKLLNSLDFRPGYSPKLIPHNFYLKLIKDDEKEIVIQGTPRPGVLKNVTRVTFHIDPDEYLLREMDIRLVDKSLSGRIEIEYNEINGIQVPVGLHGSTAIELRKGILVGMDLRLRGNNIKINTDLPDSLFDPGF